jgi:hypothetical protein
LTSTALSSSIGEAVPGAVSVCQRLISAGHQLILWTMRDGIHLVDAVAWCEAENIDFWGINCNPDQHWSKSPKAYAQIDDAALGCPLIHPLDSRPYVDWEAIETLLKGYRIL